MKELEQGDGLESCGGATSLEREWPAWGEGGCHAHSWRKEHFRRGGEIKWIPKAWRLQGLKMAEWVLCRKQGGKWKKASELEKLPCQTFLSLFLGMFWTSSRASWKPEVQRSSAVMLQWGRVPKMGACTNQLRVLTHLPSNVWKLSSHSPGL